MGKGSAAAVTPPSHNWSARTGLQDARFQTITRLSHPLRILQEYHNAEPSLLNRITHYFEDVDSLLTASWAARPDEPIALYIDKHELAELLARNIMAMMENRPAFYRSDEERDEYRRAKAERRAFFEWVRRHTDEQLAIAVLPCDMAGAEGEEG